MALVVYDRVQQTGTANTTVSFTLSGSVPGFQSFSVVGNNNVTYYAATDASGNWEVGIGTYSTTGPTLARTTILSSSNSGSAVTFSGTVNVFVTYPSEKSINYDVDGVATIGETVGYSDTGVIASFVSTVAGYNQVIFQNKSNATNASANINVSNDVTTSTYGYAELGINSSVFSNGPGCFNLPGASYLASASTDLAIGTYGAYNIHFATNSNTTDAMTIFNDGGISLGGLADPGIGVIACSNIDLAFQSIVSAAGTTTFTNGSPYYTLVTGTTTQTIKLPDATTCLVGATFIIDNDSTGIVTIKDGAGTSFETIITGGIHNFVLENNGTVAGTWIRYSLIPSEVDWGTNSLQLNTTVITGGTWNGGTIQSGYGGTGLTTFTAANNALYSTGASTLTAGTLPVAAGGTGATATPTNGQLLIGNGSTYSVASLGTGTGISTTTGSGTLTINNTGVTSAVAGTGISVSGATGAVTISNSGVTSLAGTSPVSASASTGSVTVSLSSDYGDTQNPYASKTANYVLAGPTTGAAAAPTFRALVAADIPSLSYVSSVTGTSPVASSGGNTPAISLSSGYGDTQNPYASKTANYFLAAPNGASGAPTFRAVVAADIPTLNQNTTGSAGSVANALTMNNSGTGAVSGTTYNGSGAQTISYNTIGAAPAAGSTAITSVGTLTAGTWTANSIATTYTAAKVTDVQAGTGVSVSATTGSVTVSIPQAVSTTSNVQFGSFGVGTAASGTSGEIRATNNVTAYYSDDRMKTRLGKIDGALDKLKTLDGFYYEANELAQSMGYEAKKEVGVSAQQVQAILPEVVAPAPIDANYLTVRYERLVPLLIEAIKELEAQVAELKAR